MTPTANAFEDRLLDALLNRFDTLTEQPTPAPVRVPGRARIRRYAIPVACLAAAVTAVSLVLELGGPAPVKHVESAAPAYALAAWATQPTSADQAQITAAEARCSGSFGPTGAAPASTQKQAPPEAGGPWNAELVDTRANLTLALYSNGTHWIACLTSPSFVWLGLLDATAEPPVADNTASLDKVSTRTDSGALYTVAVGRTGPGVTAVGLQRVDGSVVTATVGNGCFIAWWPEGEGVQALSVTTNNGTQTYRVDSRFSRSGPQPNNKAVRSLPGQPNNKS